MGQARRRRDQARLNDGGTSDPRFTAAVDLVGRTGATGWVVTYTEPEQGAPSAWVAIAQYDGAAECAAGWTPLSAALRLCERLIDGGKCVHCERPSGFTEDFDTMPAGDLVCWYQYDPELKKFRRGCEGDVR